MLFHECSKTSSFSKYIVAMFFVYFFYSLFKGFLEQYLS